MTSTPISHSAPTTMTWPPLSHTGNGGLHNIHVELNTMPQQQQEAVPVQQQQTPPPLLIHASAHQQPWQG
jgi:hypothetical protein